MKILFTTLAILHMFAVTVRDANTGELLPAVELHAKSGRTYYTDLDGVAQIDPQDTVSYVSYVSYQTETVTLSGESDIKLNVVK